MEETQTKTGMEILKQEVGVADMINLEEMNQETLLGNIELRYKNDIIYVSAQNINPFFPKNDSYLLDRLIQEPFLYP